MNFRFTPVALVLGCLLGATAGIASGAEQQERYGLSDYQYFRVYPFLDRGQKALKNRDEKQALENFQHALQLAPDNSGLTLILAEAYRQFGHDDSARKLLSRQLKKDPNNPALRQAFDVLPEKLPQIRNRADLLAWKATCDAVRCWQQVARQALTMGELEVASQISQENALRDSEEGRELTSELAQRAIGLSNWSLADESFARMDRRKTLSEEEYQQWFAILLRLRHDDRILDLQRQGVMNSPDMQLAYAQSLARRGETQRLRSYLKQRQPRFNQQGDEYNWLWLLATRSENPPQAVADYAPQFAANKAWILNTLVPLRLQQQDRRGAETLLETFPGDEGLNQRLALSLAEGNGRQAAQYIRQLNARSALDWSALDRYSYQLVVLKQPAQALALLIDRWPFNGAGARQNALIGRTLELARQRPQDLTARQRQRLAEPGGSPAIRMMQASLFSDAGSCPTLRTLLGDFSAGYDAATWSRLVECYRPIAPGLSLFAAQQAQARDSGVYYQRQAAYLAYEVQDWSLADRLWREMPPDTMADEDIRAAALSAREAQDVKAQAHWQEVAWMRNLADPLAGYSAGPGLAVQGGALYQRGDMAGAAQRFRQALEQTPDDPQLLRQMIYVSQRLDNKPDIKRYSERVVDDIDNTLVPGATLSDEQRDERFNLRRIHEDSARRWTFTFDSTLGLTRDSRQTASGVNSNPQPGSYRSYAQAEAEYRLGRNQIIDGDLLSVYTRMTAGSAGRNNMAPVFDPLLAAGIRWKPLREQVFYLAAEQQIPLDKNGDADLMLRASASFFNGGRFSDDWHPRGQGWFAQNLYLDAAHYVRADNQLYTADYRQSWHQKISSHQTLEPYWHLQYSATSNAPGWQDYTRAGIGVRFNHWSGETDYDAFAHKTSVGLEYQRTLDRPGSEAGNRNGLFLTLGVRW
ncbi:NfrA family protein [Entomohabitans teleogrylli]|uniref:NfrA family protein n=1 Tax=Entomohabitans teleogrylli TaxID=1384589 RepID=UPI00073D9B50|nr:tetratricopeptide repeat protein [Entomohabitans teleogrylli]